MVIVDGWRHAPQARQILRKLKVAIVFEPIETDERVGYRFYGTASISGLLSGLPLLVASPSGTGTEWIAKFEGFSPKKAIAA